VKAEKKEEESEEEEEEEEKEEGVDEFSSKLKEDYGLDNEEALQELIDNALEIEKKNEELVAELEEVKKKPGEPVFKSETQKKVYEFIKDYDPERVQDGLHAYATLVGMNVEKNDPKLLLEQQFLMKHPNLPIDKARKKFEKNFNEKYLINEDDFDDKAKYQDAKEDLETDLEIEADEARKFLKEKQKEFKVSSENKKEEANTPEVNEKVEVAMTAILSETKAHMAEVTTLNFQDDEDEDIIHTHEFTKEQLKMINETMTAIAKSPSSYNSKGQLNGFADVEDLFQAAAFLLFRREISAGLLGFAKKLAPKIKVEEIGKKKPSRKATAKGDAKPKDFMAQAEELGNKRASARQTVQY
jgi:hypothetical protein